MLNCCTQGANEEFEKWNTYGDPPNSVLLRQYGHVDYIPLPEGGFGNPGDVVELRADLVVQSTGVEGSIDDNPEMKERIDFWLEEGGDECVFLADLNHHILCLMFAFLAVYLCWNHHPRHPLWRFHWPSLHLHDSFDRKLNGNAQNQKANCQNQKQMSTH